MNPKPNPFSLYDFLGYFIPGASGIYSFLIIEQFFKIGKFDIKEIVNVANLDNIGFYLPFIILSYITGHLLSYLSSMTIEKFSIWRYGYPSKYLLGIRHDGFWGKQKLIRQKVWRVFIVLLLFPVFTFDLIIGEVFRGRAIFKRQVDPLLKDIIIKHKLTLLKKMGVKKIAKYGDINELDFFRVIQHYTYEESKTHQPKMQNYVALYGFLRTISFLLIIIFWTYIFHCINNVHINYAFSLLIITLISIVGYIFYLGFIKFYRRYTLEGYMTLISIQKLNSISIQEFK